MLLTYESPVFRAVELREINSAWASVRRTCTTRCLTMSYIYVCDFTCDIYMYVYDLNMWYICMYAHTYVYYIHIILWIYYFVHIYKVIYIYISTILYIYTYTHNTSKMKTLLYLWLTLDTDYFVLP